LGDIEICLIDDDSVVTVYEMKNKCVNREDIDIALDKIARSSDKIHNYLFITTERIDPNVVDYATNLYKKTDGTEIAILDCLSFLRHFLHLFHRIRIEYLDVYQDLVLHEPNSAVNHALKEAFLALRAAAESDDQS